MTDIEHVRRCSQYLDILLRNNPGYLQWLLEERNLEKKYPLTGLYTELQRAAQEAQSFNDLLRIFRRFKQRHFLRIGARDLLHKADLVETTGQLSDLASVALQIGLEVLTARWEWWAWGEESSVWENLRKEFSLVVLGLGKLGGHELNYVSDIDIIFLFSGHGEDDPEHITILSRLAHWLSRLLSDRFEGDRVFQVDFRLRPQGKDGILVPSMSAAVDYYLLHGLAWERQMLLKCRPVAGNRSAGTAFLHELRPFVFRRFLDFQALAELRAMRNRILTESVRFRPGSRQFDVKLGIGGIREIEFLVQSMQLIYGGRHPELDEPNTLKCLEKLSALGLVPKQTACELKESYIFLRNVEHCIQLDQNRQTQRLPQSEDGRGRLVLAMGYDREEAFMQALAEHCSRVNGHFTSLFREPDSDEEQQEAPRPSARLENFPAEPLAKLRETLQSFSGIEADVLRILEEYAGIEDHADEKIRTKVLFRLDNYFSRVARRPGLKKLFGTDKPWIAPLCRALASSELLSSLLTHNPGLVEGVALGPGRFVPGSQWEAESSRLMENAGDYEEKLLWLRRLSNERTLGLILADLAGEIDFNTLEHELSSVADFVIRNTFEAVRQNLDISPDIPLSVLGMGKLGSREMSYLSDLDLVFVYTPKPGEGEERIPGRVVRLIQRFMNMLKTPFQEGPGYEVDARLRPTGNYGPLVVTQKSWLEYYETNADIWEIQALLRVRHIAGDPGLGRWIEERARDICLRERPSDSVWPRICHLRDRMEKERAEETETDINLKLGLGGLADIEFLVQGTLLVDGFKKRPQSFGSVRKAACDPSLLHGDNPDRAGEVASCFKTLRALDHRLRLYTNASSARVNAQQFAGMLALGLWPPKDHGNGIETWQDLLRLRREVRAIFRHFCPA